MFLMGTCMRIPSLNIIVACIMLPLTSEIVWSNQNEQAERAFLQAARTGDQSTLLRLAAGDRDFRASERLNVGDTPLGVAVKIGNGDLVGRLLENGANPNLTDAAEWPPLAWAVVGDYPEIARLLISRGASVDRSVPTGGTIADMARQIGSPQLLSALSIRTATPDVALARLMQAIMSDNTDGIAAAVTEGASPRATDRTGIPMIFAAAAMGRTGSLLKLLELGAEPSQAAPGGLTALLVAVRQGHTRVVDVLLERNADPLARTDQGISVLDAARANGSPELIRVIEGAIARRDRNQGVLLLTAAANRGDVDFVRMLLGAGVPPNGIGSEPPSLPLNAAAFSGHTDVVRVLLEGGATPNSRDARGVSAVLAAALGGQKDLVRQLVIRGADATIADRNGNSPASVAIIQGWGSEFRALVPAATVTSEQVRLAVRQGDSDFLRLHYGSNPGTGRNIRLNDARTELHNGLSTLSFAVSQGNISIVETLLRLGANPDGLPFGEALGPLHIAAMDGKEAIVRLLLQTGADPLLQSADKRTAREITPTNHRQIITLLQAAERTRARELSQALRGFGYQIPVNETWNVAKQEVLDTFKREYSRFFSLNILEWINIADRQQIRICNPTAQPIYFTEAIMIAPGQQTFRLNGWFKIDSGQCGNVRLKELIRPGVELFVQAEGGGRTVIPTHENDRRFCVFDRVINQETVTSIQGDARCPTADRGRAIRFARVPLDPDRSGLVMAR
jgi:ankyrin repeat protein